MFSGIIEQLGSVEKLEPIPSGQRLFVKAPGLGALKQGESVCTNGVCLTVILQQGGSIAYDLSLETLRRSSLGALKPGDAVNLERALAVGDRLGGHFVSGHVDGVGRVERIEAQGEGSEISFSAPAELMPFIAEKGSVSVEGVSLTTWSVSGNCFKVAFIPHTLKATNLGAKRAGDPVNLEIDLLARYLHRLVQAGAASPAVPLEWHEETPPALGGTLLARAEDDENDVKIFETSHFMATAEQARKALAKGKGAKAGKAGAAPVQESAFSQALSGQAEQRVRLDLDELMEQLSQQGEALARRQNFDEMEKFKKLVTAFLDKLVSQLYKLQAASAPAAQRHKRINVILQKVDEQMDALAKNVLARQATALDVLARVDQIRGLLCDLYK